jgi:hypothetical protein
MMERAALNRYRSSSAGLTDPPTDWQPAHAPSWRWETTHPDAIAWRIENAVALPEPMGGSNRAQTYTGRTQWITSAYALLRKLLWYIVGLGRVELPTSRLSGSFIRT